MNAVPVLLYHSIDDEPRSDVARWSVTPRQFREHMRLLRDEGWNTLTVSTLVERMAVGTRLPDRSIAVTFDDGFENTLTEGVPAMGDMSATAYVTTGYLRDVSDAAVEAPGRMLTTAQLRELVDAGWEVGVHGHRHVALDAVRRQVAWNDVNDSKHLTDDALGTETTSFAYPYGYHDRVVQGYVRKAGFGNAAGVKNVHSHAGDDRWAIARITVERSMSCMELRQRLSASEPRVAPARDRLSTVGWRAARRLRSTFAGAN